MDNLTHTLTGLALSQAGLNRYYKHAAMVLMISANAPDADVVSAFFGGALTYIQYHRWITHSLIGLPVLAALSAAFVCAVTRSWAKFSTGFWLACIGLVSHLLLDWTNSYGVRVFVPFSNRWSELNLNNIIDVWIWAVLLLAALGPLLGRLISGEIGARPSTGRGLAIFALAFIVVYDYGRFLAHGQAIQVLNAHVYAGAPPKIALALPSGVNPFLWDGQIETEAIVRHCQVNLRGPFDPESGRTIYKPSDSPAIAAARQNPVFQKFSTFVQYPLWSLVPTADPEGGTHVQERDLRFPFSAEAVVTGAGQVQKAAFHF